MTVMRIKWKSGWILSMSILMVVCQSTFAGGDMLFPSIDYSNQSPYGNHEVSISHKDILKQNFKNNGIETHNLIVGLVSRRILSNLSDTSVRRELDDFDALNNLLKGVEIYLPDINKIDGGTYLFSTLFIWVSNMKCSDISLGDIVITHGMDGNKIYDFKLDIIDLAISCNLDWRYEYSFLGGEGGARVTTTKSDASITLEFESTDFNTHPPSDVDAIDGVTDIEIDTLELQGGIVAKIASLFEESLIEAIEGAINGVAKDELNSIAETMLRGVITSVADLLEQFLPENSETIDFLLPEKEMNVPDGIEILNFSTLGSETGNWFEVILNFVDDILGLNTNGTDFTINKLLRDTILNDDGTFSIPLSIVIFDGHDMLTETIITLTNVRVIGVDTINRFDSLERVGNHTLFNHFSWKHLDVEMDFDLIIKPSSKDDSIIGGPGEEVKERMTITAGLDEIDVDFHLLLAINKDKVGGTHLGSLTNANNIFPCLLDTIHHVEVAGLAVDSTAIDIPTLSGFISPGIDRVMSDTSDAVFDMYEAVLIKAIPNIFQITVKKALNELITSSFANFDVSCPRTNFPSNETFVNFPDILLSEDKAMTIGGSGESQYGHIFRDVMGLVESELLKTEPNGKAILNDMLISRITEIQSGIPGSVKLPTEVGANMQLEIGELIADFEIKVSDVQIDNIDSIGVPLSLLQPIAPQILNNTVGFGVGPKSLQGNMILTVGFSDGSDIDLRNVVLLSLDLQGVADAAAHLSIIENALMNFPIEDILNHNCWLSMMPAPVLDSKGVRLANSEASMALKNVAIALSAFKLNVTCIECSSPLLEELAVLFSSEDAVTELTEVMNIILDYITDLLGGTFLQVQLDRMITQAPLQCPHSSSYDENIDIGGYDSFRYQKQASDSMTFLHIVATIMGAMLVIVTVIYVIVTLKKRRLQKMYINSISDNEFVSLQLRQTHEIEKYNRLNAETHAMFMSPSIPLFIRVLIPLVVIANIGFFLSGHLSLGASVDFDIQLAGETVRIQQLFVFSMAESVLDMWEAGAKELAILILVFSGLWPYTKQLAILILWFTPPRWTSVKMRESILIWLDRLGKWSFVDIFVLILSLSSFRVTINTPEDVAYLPKDFFKLNLLVIPCWGLYSNMIAQIISQVNSHFIIHFNRKIQFDHERSLVVEKCEDIDNDLTPLYKHSFLSNHSRARHHLLPIASAILTFLALSFVVLLLIGCAIPSYSLEQFGLVGLTSTKPFVAHDIFSTVKLLADQADFTGLVSDRIGLGVLSFLLILTVLIVPLVQLALSLWRWFRPMSKKTRFRFFVAIEALAAWQYIEVYLFSIIVASWQLGGVSEFLINDYCGGLEDTFAMLQYYGILGVNDAQCFRVSAKIESATWILITASIVLALINHIIHSAATQQEEDIKNDDNSNSFDIIVPGYSERAEIQESGKRLLEPIRFIDIYPFLLRQSFISVHEDKLRAAEDASTSPTPPTSPLSPKRDGVGIETFSPIPYNHDLSSEG